MATLLCFVGRVEDPNIVAKEMFRAKTAKNCTLPAFDMVWYPLLYTSRRARPHAVKSNPGRRTAYNI